MRKRRTIVAALGQKGVRYGVGATAGGRYFPRALLILVEFCRAESYDISRGGLVVSYSASPHAYKLLAHFLSCAEAMREILPDLGIGISEGAVPARFRWFGLRPDFTIDPQAAERALERVQGEQTYRDEFERLRVANTELAIIVPDQSNIET
jgi:hypothetical protein